MNKLAIDFPSPQRAMLQEIDRNFIPGKIYTSIFDGHINRNIFYPSNNVFPPSNLEAKLTEGLIGINLIFRP